MDVTIRITFQNRSDDSWHLVIFKKPVFLPDPHVDLAWRVIPNVQPRQQVVVDYPGQSLVLGLAKTTGEGNDEPVSALHDFDLRGRASADIEIQGAGDMVHSVLRG